MFRRTPSSIYVHILHHTLPNLDTSVFACDGGTKECDLFGKSKCFHLLVVDVKMLHEEISMRPD